MKVTIRIRIRSDGQYVAVCPSLPGCEARARTRESVSRKMRDAVSGYLASMNVALPASGVVPEVLEVCS